MRVDLRTEAVGAVPDLVGRTAYRVVQEALTNARKHAPGAEVRVRLSGAPGRGLAVEVQNEPPDRAPPPGAASPAAVGPGSAGPEAAGPGSTGAMHPDPPLPGPPVGERSPTAGSRPGVVHSPAPASEAALDPATGPGQGLVGLAERVALASGRLEHGPTAAGGWRLVAWLPWPA